MARHRNGKGGRKIRRCGSCGMSKHRESGASKRNRYDLRMQAAAVNRAADVRARVRKARRGEMYETVGEAVSAARSK